MTEQDIARIVLAAVPPLPPPPDRLASVLRRARAQRIRHASVTAAFAVTLAAAASGLVLTGPGGSSPFGVASSGSPSPPAPSPSAVAAASAEVSPSNVPSRSPLPEMPKTVEARLEAASRDALHRAAPDASLIGDLRFQDSFSGEYGAIQLLTAAGRTGTLVVAARRATGQETCASEVAAGCTQSTGPDGERILSVPATGDGSSNGKRNRAVIVLVVRPADRVLVTVQVDNATEITQYPDVSQYTMERTGYTGELPPLTLAQAKKIALEVAAKAELP
ncbi:hypothetical protein [Catellatospora citrea]|uniref:Uncharacterized protein n=1 Tax=Catellatospora citrea TaxID=53366 RepID=A0A8J3K7M2_9ACTN|nr:hypothetical protein [Catellatospora citrea]RKE07453.1 hypothetical protein C8E86_2281 [Catellatospora citrea]GIF95609.1 hypothetical protein Cci01nite_07030 [Catellatospora citrea]